jgi:hypothetical protein
MGSHKAVPHVMQRRTGWWQTISVFKSKSSSLPGERNSQNAREMRGKIDMFLLAFFRQLLKRDKIIWSMATWKPAL